MVYQTQSVIILTQNNYIIINNYICLTVNIRFNSDINIKSVQYTILYGILNLPLIFSNIPATRHRNDSIVLGMCVVRRLRSKVVHI